MPAVASAANGGVQCARCQRSLARPAFANAVSDCGVGLHEAPAGTTPEQPAVEVEAWRLDEVLADSDRQPLQQIGRSLRSAQTRSQPGERKPTDRRFRVDPASSAPRPAAAARPVIDSTTPAAEPRDPYKAHSPYVASQAVAWLAALLGAVLLGLGLGMLGLTLIGKPGLWVWGLTGTLAGQGLMVVGLVLLLANLWTGSRTTAGRVQALHHEVRRLQRTADTLTGIQTATPTTFYADLARGSNPQVLLANLKGQVDHLASRVSERGQ